MAEASSLIWVRFRPQVMVLVRALPEPMMALPSGLAVFEGRPQCKAKAGTDLGYVAFLTDT